MHIDNLEQLLDLNRNGPYDETSGIREQKLKTLFRPLIRQINNEDPNPINWKDWISLFETRILKQGLPGVIDWAVKNLPPTAQHLLVVNLKVQDINQNLYLPSDLPSDRSLKMENPLEIIDYIEKRFAEAKK